MDFDLEKRRKRQAEMKKRTTPTGLWVALGTVVLMMLVLVFGARALMTPGVSQTNQENQNSPALESLQDDAAQNRDGTSSDAMSSDDRTADGRAASERDDASTIADDATALPSPIALPEPHGPVFYRRGVNIESWSTQAEVSCQEYARPLLYALSDAGTNLVEAGYLDLFGNVWGCVAQSESGVFTITIETRRPASNPSVYSGSLSSSYGWCEVTIVRTFIPEMTLGDQLCRCQVV